MKYSSVWHLILKPFFWIRTPYKYQLFEYFICGKELYIKHARTISNNRIIFRNLQFKKTKFTNAVNFHEEMYLLLLHEDNIAHFFHDVFFPLYYAWRKDKKRILVSINANQFLRDFLSSAIDQSYLVFADRHVTYAFKNLIVIPEGRDLKAYPNFSEICKEIKYACFSINGIKELRSRNILYGRNELERKNLLNIDKDFLILNHIELTHLSKLSFVETITLLAETKNFIYMVGAGVFYLLFLDRIVNVIEINPAKNNSWAQMFGLSEICNLHVVVSQNLKNTEHAMQSESLLDSHVLFDDLIKEAILELPL